MSDERGEDKAADAIARKLVAQCRNDIKAAWDQLEAARGALAHSRWLRSRWEAQKPTTDAGTSDAAGADAGTGAPAAKLNPRVKARGRARGRRQAKPERS